MATGYPDLAAVRDWLNLSPAVLSDAQLQAVLDAEIVAQAKACRLPVDPDPIGADLYAAILRRVARHVAARGVPLGLAGGEAIEWGPARLTAYDGEIERLEGATRVFHFG